MTEKQAVTRLLGDIGFKLSFKENVNIKKGKSKRKINPKDESEVYQVGSKK